ncbi:MAG: L-threonylcarbamoyladenylate synthase, partial [Planctomycetota bacterium]
MSDVPVLSVGADPSNDRDAVERAASILRAGGLVAVPTETVYGLAARADDGAAVARIYSAKGRPAHNPLIVHVASLDEARALATEWPGSAQALAEALWPGPLTLVVRRRGDSLAAVSAGRDTIAVRVPDHPVLLEVLVLTSLEGKIDLVLDGGPCSVGIESSVVDVTGPTPRLLRPGGTPVDELRRIAPDLTLADPIQASRDRGHLSPGLGRRHYSPTAPMRLVALRELAIEADRLSGAIGLLTLQPLTSPPSRIAWS